MATGKELIRDKVHFLKKKGIIKFDSDIARDLNYTRGAVSEILSVTSKKPVTASFLHKFEEKYGKYFSKQKEVSDDLRATIEVLKLICIKLWSKETGSIDSARAEIEDLIEKTKKR